MTRRWEGVLDDQLDLFRFAQSDFGRQFHQGFARSLNRTILEATGNYPAPPELEPELKAFERGVPDLLEQLVWNADPVYIEPDMMTLAEAAAPEFKPEPLTPQDLLIPAGFLTLPRPWYIKDVRGRNIAIRYLLWGPMGRPDDPVWSYEKIASDNFDMAAGITVMMFSHLDDPDDYLGGENRIQGDYDLRKMNGSILLAHIQPWVFGRSYSQDATSSVFDVVRFLQCLWRLMAQKIAIHDTQRQDRAGRRRLQKSGWPDKTVTVIRLRRPRADPNPDAEPRHVEWTHRWITSGHWRDQPYPSLGVGVTRQIWISAYIKGPADKELLVRKLRVFEWVQ